MSSTATPGPSNLRPRNNRPPSLQNIESNHDELSSHRGSPAPSSSSKTQRDDPGSSNTTTSSNVHFPGGLYLPAVKGTIGGIESPRRHMRSAPSISTLRDDSSNPPDSASTIQPRKEGKETTPPPSPPPASRAVFRSDPTIKSCLNGLKMDRAGEIARLFGV
ncbi:uncharacterized protein I206_107539 [Kwoniella pini CBS 10737]|uniref:Uncharacterized protein n=1 Tax=Kwoniella pini CBS 10737 TaxID=1296096 RepID=A0A1B9HXL8_9TREE|nr:uncharacterized protein I206_05867 [Kwoniella pini CBS 10737]OCF48001.1 hypothetical protein I206_05867 [Kwoniella pini CBS 10737]